MCNYLHPNSKPIPENGFGYKVFEKKYNGELVPLFNVHQSYIENPSHWIKWRSEFNDPNKPVGCGFCFFRTSRGAMKLIEAGLRYGFSKDVIKKIEYRKGLGSHVEHNIGHESFKISLCKEFRIIEP